MAFVRDIMVGIRRLIDIQDRQHNDLTNRDALDCHPSSSITELSTDLTGKVDKSGSITQIATRNHNDLQNRSVTGAHPASAITDLTLSGLSDVLIVSPTTDQTLRYSGIQWTNSGQIVVGAGPGIIFYLDSTEIIPPGPGPQTFPIETLSKIPTGGVEVSESVTVNNSTGLIDQYLYNTALGISSISAGEWTFDTYCSVDNASGVSEIIISVAKVFIGAGTIAITGAGTSRIATVTGGTPFLASDFNADITQTSYIITPTAVLRIIGFTSTSVVTVETLATYTNETGVAYSVDRYLFQDTTGEINNLTVALFTHTQVQPAFAVNTTDKLTVRYYGRTTNVGNIIITIYHNGTEHYTRIHTPFPTLHNDLAGLQGGAGNEFYHSTLAEYTGIGTGPFARQTALPSFENPQKKTSERAINVIYQNLTGKMLFINIAVETWSTTGIAVVWLQVSNYPGMQDPQYWGMSGAYSPIDIMGSMIALVKPGQYYHLLLEKSGDGTAYVWDWYEIEL